MCTWGGSPSSIGESLFCLLLIIKIKIKQEQLQIFFQIVMRLIKQLRFYLNKINLNKMKLHGIRQGGKSTQCKPSWDVIKPQHKRGRKSQYTQKKKTSAYAMRISAKFKLII